MLLRLLKDLGTGVVFFIILYVGGGAMLQNYLLYDTDIYSSGRDICEAFQSYVWEQALDITDTEQIRDWVEERSIDEFVISQGSKVYFDNRYADEVFPAARTNNTGRYLFSVSFSDAKAELYIYDGYADGYFDLFLGVSILLSVTLCLLIFQSELQEEIGQICTLKDAVERIGAGELEEKVRPESSDEIGQLAEGIDSMRRQLLEQQGTQKRMKQAQDELVLGMAHDLRTPMTGLFSYLEVIKRMEREERPTAEYTEKAFQKAMQLRTVSEQLFEYFLASNENGAGLEEPEIVQSALEDYLSEFCAFLECNGYQIDADEVRWEPVRVSINSGFVGRIMNNLMSNIEKYAVKESPVHLGLVYETRCVVLTFQNAVITPNPYVKGTGIGLKNIDLMMRQMNGGSEHEISEELFCIRLAFPVIRGEAE